MFGDTKKEPGGRIYLDYAAATPVRPAVFAVMEPYWKESFANPSAIHREGVIARNAVEDARETVAQILHIRTGDVVFTGSGTESNNLAIFGVVRALKESGKKADDMEVISTSIEHPSVRAVLEELAKEGVVVHECKVGEDGRIDLAHLASLLGPKTVLVTFAYVNSEVGVVQDVKRIARAVRLYNTQHGTRVLVHLDAAQAPLWLPCQMDMLGADLMSLDAGKCYGPKGVGVLARRHKVPLAGVMLGGGQEDGRRAGTENTPLIVGCVEALCIADERREERCRRAGKLRDRMIEKLLADIPGAVLNGSREHRVANNVNISLPGIDSEYAVISLDAKGIAAATKSACSGADGGGSHVVRTLTGDDERAASTIRFTLGEETTESDLDRAVEALTAHIAMMKDALGNIEDASRA